jgi:hypothetical protein
MSVNLAPSENRFRNDLSMSHSNTRITGVSPVRIALS